MLTTVPSINAMLEARIVAIKTQGPLHGFNRDLMGIIIRWSILIFHA
jgi:hypothetical protein